MKNDIIEIQEEIRIKNLILEKGDKIKIIPKFEEMSYRGTVYITSPKTMIFFMENKELITQKFSFNSPVLNMGSNKFDILRKSVPCDFYEIDTDLTYKAECKLMGDTLIVSFNLDGQPITRKFNFRIQPDALFSN